MASGGTNTSLQFPEKSDFSTVTTITPLETSSVTSADSTIPAFTTSPGPEQSVQQQIAVGGRNESHLFPESTDSATVTAVTPLETSTVNMADSTISAFSTLPGPEQSVQQQIVIGGKNESRQFPETTDFATVTTVTPLESSTLADSTTLAITSSLEVPETTSTMPPTIATRLNSTDSFFTTPSPDVTDFKTTVVSEGP